MLWDISGATMSLQFVTLVDKNAADATLQIRRLGAAVQEMNMNLENRD